MRQRNPRIPKQKKTRAWVELCKRLETQTQQEIADSSKVAQSVISSLATLQSLPDASTIAKLEKIGLKAAWWFETAAKGKAA